MELATLDITPEAAKEQLAHYQAQLQDERTREDEAIAAGYRAAARGLPVIQLSRSIEAGGWHPNGLPRIAVVRADAGQCWVEVGFPRNDRTDIVFSDVQHGENRGALVGRHTVRANVDAAERTDWRDRNVRPTGSTVVPLVPPQHRPRLRRLGRFHILWEVERWDITPPRDPALLRHIRGDLWAVLATWQLTDLERAVLSARATSS